MTSTSLPAGTLVRELAEHHASFAPAIADLEALADVCPELTTSELHDRLEGALAFLERRLLPHAVAEEAVLYPAVAERLGAPEATATMVRDHVEVRRLIRELRRRTDELGGQLLPVARREVVQLLYALHAVLTLHLAKEEDLYLPLLTSDLDHEGSGRLLHALREARTAAEADGLTADGG